MAYFKKSQKKVNGKWYPQGVTIGKPVQTKEVANRLADLSALSPGDCYSMLGNLGKVLGEFMNAGRTVKLDGVGTFYYTPNTRRSQRKTDYRHARPLYSRSGTLGQRSGQHPFAGQRKHLLGGTETRFVCLIVGRRRRRNWQRRLVRLTISPEIFEKHCRSGRRCFFVFASPVVSDDSPRELGEPLSSATITPAKPENDRRR